MSDILKKLSEPLKPSEVGVIADWKTVQKTTKGKVAALFLPYKTSRSVYSRFNDVCGGGWRDDYTRDEKGILICSLSVHFEKLGWITRKGAGTPNNKEKEKSEYSDALKRASTAFGFGIELYSMPKIIINLNEDEYYTEGQKVLLSQYLDTKLWKLDYKLVEKRVEELKITDQEGKIRWQQ